LTIYLMQKDVGQRRRNHSALRRTSVRASALSRTYPPVLSKSDPGILS
jgi:hypothetical protein